MAEQLDPCITRKPFAPLQGNTHLVPQLEKNAVQSQTETGTIYRAAQISQRPIPAWCATEVHSQGSA